MRLRRPNSILLSVVGLLFASAGIAETTDLAEELKACSKLMDREARFACYDALGQDVLDEKKPTEQSAPVAAIAAEAAATPEPASAPGPESEPEPETAATTVAAEDDTPIPDDLGGVKFEEKAQSNLQYTGRITSCQQGHYGNWYFFFDNGQVWKDVNKRRLRLKDCDFEGTITKDRIGYELDFEGLDRPVRVRRHR